MEIPQAFVENVRQEGGEQWLASLPAQLEHWCSRWDLTVVGAPRHGYLGLVFPVTCPQGPAVLKLTRVDPKPLRGDPEFAVAPLLWNRFDGDLGRLDQIVTEAGLDWERTRQWTLFRVLEYWLWALNLGFSEDPERCTALAERLAQPTQP